MENKEKSNSWGLIAFIAFILFLVNPIFSLFFIIVTILNSKKIFKNLNLQNYQQNLSNNHKDNFNGIEQSELALEEGGIESGSETEMPLQLKSLLLESSKKRLEKRKKYLHIALNSTLEEAKEIISQLPISDRILIEAGTPLIKIYGTEAISQIKAMAPAGTYIVADNKCADLASREVEMMVNAGANASTCLGVAPIETIDSFIEECEKFNIDSIIDMMNVESSLAILKKLKKLPNVVMLHRGVDESEFSKEKQIPYYQIKQIKGNYDILVAVAGGDDIREVQRAIFNDADIVVVWKSFYHSTKNISNLANEFLREIV